MREQLGVDFQGCVASSVLVVKVALAAKDWTDSFYLVCCSFVIMSPLVGISVGLSYAWSIGGPAAGQLHCNPPVVAATLQTCMLRPRN